VWAFLIGLAVSVVKTFATSTASSAGSKLGESLFSHAGEGAREVVVAGSQPGASREQQLTATQQLLNALKTDEAFRNEVRSILETHAPETLAEGEQVQKHLEQNPAVVQEVVTGVKPVTDFTDPLYLWSLMGLPSVSTQQAAFLRSPSFHRVCPVGREDLGLGPEVMGAVHYEHNVFGTPTKVNLPTMPLPGAPGEFVAVCKSGHRWPVFAT
jgi:hypothetical protein